MNTTAAAGRCNVYYCSVNGSVKLSVARCVSQQSQNQLSLRNQKQHYSHFWCISNNM